MLLAAANSAFIPQQAYRFPRLLGKTTNALNVPREAIRFSITISSYEVEC